MLRGPENQLTEPEARLIGAARQRWVVSPMEQTPGRTRSPLSRDEIAGALLRAYLERPRIAAYLPGEPSGAAAVAAAEESAPEFLETLGDIYGVRDWTPETFRRAFIDGALAHWRPGSKVQETGPDSLRIISDVCPSAGDVALDARVCQACRTFQQQVVRIALPAQVKEVRHDHLISRGDAVCTVDIEVEQGRDLTPN